MKHAFSFIFVAVVGFSAFGYTPTPEKTCERLQELSDKEASEKDKKSTFSTAKCLKKLNEIKERDPDAYKCGAKMASKLSSFQTAIFAISVCDKNAPKKTDDDDDKKSDDDSAKKKKKKAADDE